MTENIRKAMKELEARGVPDVDVRPYLLPGEFARLGHLMPDAVRIAVDDDLRAPRKQRAV